MENKLEAFKRLLNVMDELREKCPWDKKQTFESLRANTIEETYELCDAIMKKDMHEIKKELGDVLLHIVFYSKIASESNTFDIGDVCNTLCDKLIFRHPHVFGDVTAKSAGEVEQTWEQIKQKEKDGNKNPLSCHQVATTGVFLPWKEHQDIGISIDLAVWTPSENSLELIRIGDGESRKIL